MPLSDDERKAMEERFLQRIQRLKATPEELAQRFANARVFNYDEWVRHSRPATPEELEDMEEFLRELYEERSATLRSERDLAPEQR